LPSFSRYQAKVKNFAIFATACTILFFFKSTLFLLKHSFKKKTVWYYYKYKTSIHCHKEKKIDFKINIGKEENRVSDSYYWLPKDQGLLSPLQQ
jgi:hypothetical protein